MNHSTRWWTRTDACRRAAAQRPTRASRQTDTRATSGDRSGRGRADRSKGGGGRGGGPAQHDAERGAHSAGGPPQEPERPAPATVASLPAVTLAERLPVSALLLTFVPVDPNAPAATGAATATAQRGRTRCRSRPRCSTRTITRTRMGQMPDGLSLNEFFDRISLASASNTYEPLRADQQLQLTRLPQRRRRPSRRSRSLSRNCSVNTRNLARGGFETTSTRSQQFRAAPHARAHASPSASRTVPPPRAGSRASPSSRSRCASRVCRAWARRRWRRGGGGHPDARQPARESRAPHVDPAQLATGVSLVRVPLSSPHSSTSSSLNLAGPAGPVAALRPDPRAPARTRPLVRPAAALDARPERRRRAARAAAPQRPERPLGGRRLRAPLPLLPLHADRTVQICESLHSRCVPRSLHHCTAL